MPDLNKKFTLNDENAWVSLEDFIDGHEAEAMVYGCVDFRLWTHLVLWLKERGIKADLNLTPGAIVGFCGQRHGFPDSAKTSEFWAATMAKLHHLKRIILVSHEQCGAYKNAPGLVGQNPDDIMQAQLADLEEVRQAILATVPSIAVEMHYMRIPGKGQSKVRVIPVEVQSAEAEELELVA